MSWLRGIAGAGLWLAIGGAGCEDQHIVIGTLARGHDGGVAGAPERPRFEAPTAMTELNSSAREEDPTLTDDLLEIYFMSSGGDLDDRGPPRAAGGRRRARGGALGSWMHLRGLEIGNAKVGRSGDHSYSLLRTKGSSNNIFELLHLHHAFGPGLFIDGGEGGNLVLNCDSHDNYDQNGSQGDGQNGDGFGVHYQRTGPSTIIRGCRAWNNSDDGYDHISQEVPVITEGSFAMSNGRGSDGNGNGFKVGSSKTGIRHIVRNDVAWKNKAAGFYANHSSGGNTWLNNTAYDNRTQYNMLASPPDDSSQTIILTGALAHVMRNNVGFPNKNSNMGGVDTAFNTWDLNITETSSAFESTSDAGCTGPREADGSMPSACVFMKLTTESALIDKGTDVGLPFVGAAPDLGAYELGAEPTAGAGGGAAGGSGTAGGGMGGTAAHGSGGDGPGGPVGTSGGMGAAGDAGQGGAPGTGGSPETGGETGSADGETGGRAGGAATSEDDSAAAGRACAVASDDATAGTGGFALLALAAALAARALRSRPRHTPWSSSCRSSSSPRSWPTSPWRRWRPCCSSSRGTSRSALAGHLCGLCARRAARYFSTSLSRAACVAR
ncbi:uncharacterized protein SOCEGT47_047620 [Sorangium cellulosum]|uniref:Pel9A-like right handed beta-helix region domain-containing protein n=1 Tax=Sorangium cellulosum TaxID=56 RepID=A0A4P2Q4D4_SORCE|nr:right-handed parallel beta-helix repeat-containing protein [Sorangium cellulosum]AUX24225.1 uncharacterized protein SOCEGT47_047620 [Sorangium cellulosum]